MKLSRQRDDYLSRSTYLLPDYRRHHRRIAGRHCSNVRLFHRQSRDSIQVADNPNACRYDYRRHRCDPGDGDHFLRQ